MSQFCVIVYPSNVCVLGLMVGTLVLNEPVSCRCLSLQCLCFGIDCRDFGSK